MSTVNVTPEYERIVGYRGVWRFMALDAETELVPTWLVGERNGSWTTAFMRDLQSRLTHQVQLTTDGHKMHLEAGWDAFGIDADHAQLIKHYESDRERGERINGYPGPELISTSFVERRNFTVWMGMRRASRLTNAFSAAVCRGIERRAYARRPYGGVGERSSPLPDARRLNVNGDWCKKPENLECAVTLYYMYYNFGRKHQSLEGKTPATAAGAANHVWTIEEIVGLL